jgi:methionyl-tRNA synthetase
VVEIGTWIVTSAWPYAHDIIHLGNLIGSLLSADIFTRYLRLKGEEVIFVSGSDEHGTPIEAKAVQENRDPKELTDEVHNKISDVIKRFNIEFDNYTRTHNDIHIRFVQDFYKKIFENGYIFTKEEEVLYCSKDKLYLPDRFVIGKCPYCDYDAAKGDQCEACGRLLNPIELIGPRCIICGEKPVIKKSVHYYFDLPRFSDRLLKWLSKSTTLTENAKQFSINMIKDGLKPRSITRNNKWGIPAPFPEAGGLTIYVWFEAVLGYVSAVKEYFIKTENNDEKWKEWWFNNETNVAFFIGKDNIPFHTIIFPALLMATHDPYTFKFYIGATEYLNFEGKKFSKTHKIGIWCDEALELLPADYWRYVLTYLRPETRDTNFTWRSLDYAVNEELNNHYGNLVHRLLTLISKYFDGEITKQEPYTDLQKDIINTISKIERNSDKYYLETRFQRVLQEIMVLIKKANNLINQERPWETVKKDRKYAESTLYTVYLAVKASTIILYPIIPESTKKILKYLGIDIRKVRWADILKRENKITIAEKFAPVFSRININELKRRLKIIRGEEMEQIDMEYLSKIDIRVGLVEKVEKKVGTKKILRLYVNLGDKKVKILAGLAQYYKPEELIGKKIVLITNMKPKKIIDEYSEGMLLAAMDNKGRVKVLTVDGEIDIGSKVG